MKYLAIILLTVMPSLAMGQIESVEFVAEDRGYFYVVVDGDTTSQHNDWHKAQQSATNRLRIHDESKVYILQTLRIKAEADYFEPLLEYDWSHIQYSDAQSISLDIRTAEKVDSVEARFNGCNEVQYDSWYSDCEEKIYIFVTAYSKDEIVTKKDSVDLPTILSLPTD